MVKANQDIRDYMADHGVTQKTLSQFLWTGWVPLETYQKAPDKSRWF